MYLHFPCHVRWLSRHQILFSTLWDNPHVPKAFSGGFLERQRRRMCRMVPCYGLCHRWDALDTVLRLSVVHEQFCPIRDAYPVCLTKSRWLSIRGMSAFISSHFIVPFGGSFWPWMVYESITCEHIQVFILKTLLGVGHKSNFSCFLICTSGYTEPAQDRTQSQEFIFFLLLFFLF